MPIQNVRVDGNINGAEFVRNRHTDSHTQLLVSPLLRMQS